MSRLEEEYIMAVVRNRSGIDAGCIDYSIPIGKFEKLSIPGLEEVKKELDFLKKRCNERIRELQQKCEHKVEVEYHTGTGRYEYCSECGKVLKD